MKKKITSSALAALMIAGTTSFSALAAMPSGTVVIGTKAFDLAYANDVKNADEITNLLVAGGTVYFKDFEGNWIDNVTNAKVLASVIPAVTYKNAAGVETKFDAADKDAVNATFGVSVVGAKKLQVTFGKVVDTTKVVLSVKRGSVVYNTSSVVWNEAKTQATITMVSKLTSGDYTVNVSGIDIPVANASTVVKVENEKVTKITIDSDSAPFVSNTTGTSVTFAYAVLNQYDENVTSNTALTWSTSQGTFVTDPSTGVKQLSGAFVKDQLFTVTAVDALTGTYVSKMLKVADSAKVSKITLGGVYKADTNGDMVAATITTSSTYTDRYIQVNGKDQYGNDVDDAQLDAETTIIIPATGVLEHDAAKFVSIKGQTYLQLKKPAGTAVAGNVDVRVIANFTGLSDTINVTVTQAAVLDSLTIEAPADLVVVGETVEIPFNAFDQNGVELSETAKAAIDVDKIIRCTDPKVTFDMVYDYATKKAVLTLDATGATAGNAVVMAVTGSNKMSQFSVTIKAEAVAKTIASTKNTVTLMTIGADSTLTSKNFVVLDQYNREMALNANWFGKYRLDLTSATPTKVTVGSQITASGTTTGSSVQLAGIANGSSVINARIYDKTATVPGYVANSGYEFTASTVAKTGISSYKVETVEKLYDDKAATTHSMDFDVYGVNASNQKIALASADYTVSSNDAAVTVVNGIIDANTVTSFTTTVKEVPVNLLVVIDGANGPESIVKTVTVTNVAPTVKTLELATTTKVEIAGDIAYASPTDATIANIIETVSGLDQYGVDIKTTNTNILIDNVKGSKIAIVDNGKLSATVTGAVAGDTFRVTVYANGLTRIINVVVTN